MGAFNQPWSLAYLSSAATPASSTSMPILTGTLPSVNQCLIAPMIRSPMPGPCGGAGGTGALAAATGMGADAGNGGGRRGGAGAAANGAAITAGSGGGSAAAGGGAR